MTATPLLRWLSSSGADAIGRFVLQLGTTVVFARLLAPELFGQAALTLALVMVLSICVTAPFEEALAQRRVVRKSHFQACLSALLLLAALLCAGTVTGTRLLPLADAHARIVADLIAVYSLILFADGPFSVYTAVARRRRQFNLIAAANFVGLAVGSVVGLAMAWGGAGVWSLLAVRLVARFVTTGHLIAGVGIRLRPGRSLAPIRELTGFAGWHFADRATTAVGDALFQALVTGLYGIAANGYVNMAMRVVEPVRSAVGAVGHNIAMSVFARLQSTPDRLRLALERTVAQTSLILLPAFVGLAAVASTLIGVLAGPSWQAAAPIAVFLALAAAVASPGNFIFSAVSARGRADLGFVASFGDVLVMVAALWLLAPLGLVAIGLARFLAWAAEGVFAAWLGRRLFDLDLPGMVRRLTPIVIAIGVMASLVAGLPAALPAGLPASAVLPLQILTGIAVYGAVIHLLAGSAVRGAAMQLVRRGSDEV